jgi:hypothetical protein
MSNAKFTLNDLKRVHHDSNTLSEFTEELCYHRGIKASFKALKIKDKKDLLKSIESKDESAVNSNFDKIIEKYVSFDDDNFKSEDLTLGEKYQLLSYIRRAAAGDSVNIIHQCPECEKVTQDIKYDMKDMIVNYYNPESSVDNTILIGNIKIYLGQLTRKDEKQIEEYMKRNKLSSMTERHIISLVGAIKQIEITDEDITGNVDLSFEDKFKFFEDLSQSIIDQIVNYLKSIEHGVKLPFNFKCSNCGYENETEEASVAAFFIS